MADEKQSLADRLLTWLEGLGSQVKIRVMQDGKQIFEMKEELEISIAAQDISSISIVGMVIAAEIGKTLDFQVRFDQSRFRSACKLNVREKTS